jgi:hypothetical protein
MGQMIMSTFWCKWGRLRAPLVFVNDNKPAAIGDRFQWQIGYGAFSVTSNQVHAVIAYINRQKERHNQGALWPTLEPIARLATIPCPCALADNSNGQT